MAEQSLSRALTLGTGDILSRPPSSMSRYAGFACGAVFGLATQVLFLYTAVLLFFFLRDGGSLAPHRPWLNVSLALFFAWPHSLLLVPSVQKRLKRYMPSELMGCVHCLMTCISLLAMFALWTRTDGWLWRLDGVGATTMNVGFYASWIALFYSLYLTGMGYQTGLTPWWYWVRGMKLPRREFVERGLYRYTRHPVYLSFLGLIWFTPNMSWDHVILTVIWTIYIVFGSYMKDQRLKHYMGDTYLEYARRVPGYPWIGFGPMGRLR
jgi:methanethiol S-methyltransferase